MPNDESQEIGGSHQGGGQNETEPDGAAGAVRQDDRPPALGTPTTPTGAEPNAQRPGKKKKKRSHARIAIATLNMRGFGTANAEGGSNKWDLINQVVRDRRIAILALQETHLSDERLKWLERLFGTVLTVFGSADPENATGARGIAFAINARMVPKENVSMTEVIPRRAAILTVKLGSGGSPLKLANVYAPNNMQDNAEFWKTLSEKWSTREQKPQVMAGDFNIVEDAIDRIPMRRDDKGATKALRELCQSLSMHDGWREENGMDRAFTYAQKSMSSQSRIDRIYVADDIWDKTYDWKSVDSGISTDHQLISCVIANYRAPYVGKG